MKLPKEMAETLREYQALMRQRPTREEFQDGMQLFWHLDEALGGLCERYRIEKRAKEAPATIPR